MAVASVPAAYIAPVGRAEEAKPEQAKPLTDEEQKALDKKNKDGAVWWSVLICVGLFGLAAVYAREAVPDLKDWTPASPADGLDTFALFYVAAFVLERLLEPVASIEPLTPAKHERARDRHLKLARRASLRAAQDRELDDAATAQAAVDRWRASRALIVLGVATLAGVWMSLFLRLDFLSVAGVKAQEKHLWVHVYATALVIGGGTKPLHDLIIRIQKSKDNAKDPTETGGNA